MIDSIEEEMESKTTTKPVPFKVIQTAHGYKCKKCGSDNIKFVEYEDPKTFKTCHKIICLNCESEAVTRICVECGSNRLEYDEYHEQLCCKSCGLVLGDAPPLFQDFKEFRPALFILLKRVNF